MSERAQRARVALDLSQYPPIMETSQVADMLGLSVDEADGFLKKRGIPLLSTIDDFDDDQQVLQELLA